MRRLWLIVVTVALMGAVAIAEAQAPQPPLPPVRVGNGIPPPVKTKDVKPVYPPEAQGAGVQGVVIIEAIIGPTGLVQDAHIVRSIPLLDAAALAAVRQWEFTPTVVDGVPRSVVMTVTVNFTVSLPRGPTPSSPAPPPSMFLLTTANGQNGTRYVFEIPLDRAERLPRWDQRISLEPPLSMLEARKAAEAWFRIRAPEIRAFELVSLSLSRAVQRPQGGACGAAGCWFYRMSFDPVVADRRLFGGGDFTAVVLLDGSIVEPRTEPMPPPGAGQPASGAASPVDRGPNGIYRIGDAGITMPRILRQAMPNYTSAAMKQKIQGMVIVEAVVDTDGKIRDAKVVRSLDPTYGLDQEALKAARLYLFEPGSRLGVPVPVLVTIEMTFTTR